MAENLEGEKPKVEGVKPTPVEGAEPTKPKETPTVSITETEEFRHALDKALGKALASTNQQVSLHKAASESAKAEVEEHKAAIASIEAELQDLRKQHDDLVGRQFDGDPEARQAYVDRRAIADAKRDLAKEKAGIEKKLYEAEKLAWSVAMARRADNLVKETGIDVSELEGCHTEEEMEVKALRFKLAKEPEKEPKFDSGLSSGSDASWRDLSPDEKVIRGLTRKK